MTERNYVCLYLSYGQALAPFSDEEKGRILSAMLSYAATGAAPEFDGNERYIWPTLRAQIDRDSAAYQEKCAKNRENGAKGGRPKNQALLEKTERFSEKPKKPKEKEKKKEKDIYIMPDKPAARSFLKPSVDDVKAYCTEKGYSINAEYFVDYYESNGWMVGKNKMKDWKASVRMWVSREQEKAQPVEKKKSSIADAFPPIPILG